MIKKYSEYLKCSGYSTTTIEYYISIIKEFSKYLEEINGRETTPIILCNIQKYHILNFLAYLNFVRGNCSRTRYAKFFALKNFFKWLSLVYQTNNPAKDIDFEISYKRLPKALSLDQCNHLLNYYSDSRNKLMIYLFLTSGIRLSELINIKISDIDLKEHTIKIIAKGNRHRTIYLNKKCIKMIEKFILNKSKDEYLFNARSFKMSRRNVEYIIKKALDGIGGEGCSVHSLRHTAATIMYNDTKDILLVKEFLGHSSIVSTQIYTHISSSDVREIVENNPLANFERAIK